MDKIIDIHLRDEAATEQAGRILCAFLHRGDFVGLEGELGAGKTSLTRGIMDEINPKAIRVTSPTYTLMNHYQGNSIFRHIVHADLYRLHDEDDLESTGYWDAVIDADLVVVEWIDHLPSARFEQGWTVRMFHAPNGRRLQISCFGPNQDLSRMDSLAKALADALA